MSYAAMNYYQASLSFKDEVLDVQLLLHNYLNSQAGALRSHLKSTKTQSEAALCN